MSSKNGLDKAAAKDATERSRAKLQSWVGIELLLAAVLGILAVTVFVAQVRTAGPGTTARDTFLFNTLQFILTTGFAWFSTRAASRSEFEQSLKQFAISAYRRIADIERMVERLRGEVQDMIGAGAKNETNNLRIIAAIISDTSQVVRSSISDWADVIGEELIAIEQIKRLEREKSQLTNKEPSLTQRDQIDSALRKIEDKIAALQKTLPPRLALDPQPDSRKEMLNRRAADWLAEEHGKAAGLRIRILNGPGYPHERDPRTLRPGERLLIARFDDGLCALDGNGEEAGRVLNKTPLDYAPFEDAFVLCFGDLAAAEFVRTTREGEVTAQDGSQAYFAEFEAKVLEQPLRERQPIGVIRPEPA